jgi:DNA-binding NtrC family response regulator
MTESSRSVFIVDDQLTILKMLSDILACLGYNVVSAADGYEALQTYQEKKDQIGVIILDVIMPGMNGLRTLEKLMQINPEAKVIMCSAYFDEGRLPELANFDICGFIQKPYTIGTLSKCMEEALAH